MSDDLNHHVDRLIQASDNDLQKECVEAALTLTINEVDSFAQEASRANHSPVTKKPRLAYTPARGKQAQNRCHQK